MGSPRTYARPGPLPLKHFAPEPAERGLIFEISSFFQFSGGSPAPKPSRVGSISAPYNSTSNT